MAAAAGLAAHRLVTVAAADSAPAEPPKRPGVAPLLLALHPGALILLLLDTATLVLAVLVHTASAVPTQLSSSVTAVLSLSAARIALGMVVVAVQIQAVHAALAAKPALTTRRSPYLTLVRLHSASCLLALGELGAAGALTAIAYQCCSAPPSSLVVAVIAVRWACAGLRLLLPRGAPLQWEALLAAGGVPARRAHLQGRVTAALRSIRCVSDLCDRGVVGGVGGKQYHELRYGTDGADVAALASVAVVELLGGGEKGASAASLRVAAGLDLLRRAPARAGTCPEGSPPDALLLARCRLAATHGRFALGAYTGLLLDSGRHTAWCLGCCCWARSQCSGCCGLERTVGGVRVDGDNWAGGHRASFLRYVGIPAGEREDTEGSGNVQGTFSEADAGEREDTELLAARRRRTTPGEASYFVLHRRAAREVIVAIRGTEQVAYGPVPCSSAYPPSTHPTPAPTHPLGSNSCNHHVTTM